MTPGPSTIAVREQLVYDIVGGVMLKSIRITGALVVVACWVLLTGFTCDQSDAQAEAESSPETAAASPSGDEQPASDDEPKEEASAEEEGQDEGGQDEEASGGRLDEERCKAACDMIKECAQGAGAEDEFDYDQCLRGCPTVDRPETIKKMRCMADADSCEEAKRECES
jgi:hypothetical protein